MEATFRASMNWLHTWAGVVLGGLLFTIFWMGTLSVFDRAIDRWMMPMTRLDAHPATPSIDFLAPKLKQAADEGAPNWLAWMPSERNPTIKLSWRDRSGATRVEYVDPVTRGTLPDPGTWAGSDFIYPFHYDLHIRFANIGLWLVGLASMAMLVLLVSGVVIHRRIFADFFTFRADRKPRRLILDLHNITGVLGLPFHFMITLSGLIISWSIYFPYGVGPKVFREYANTFQRPKVGTPAEHASLDAMVARARHLWNGDQPGYILVLHPGDAGSHVLVARAPDQVTAVDAFANFDATTGELLYERRSVRPIATVQRFIGGMHWMRFEHWTLRWAYFVVGLMGCVLVATGYLFWLESRRKKHAQLQLRGVPVVEALTISSVSGIIIATLSFFVANRLLPLGATFLGEGRAALEIWTFYLVWLATFAHACLRSGRAWEEQCWAISVLAIAAVLLNWISTGDHLVRSLSQRHLWSIACMDLLMLMGALLAALTARRLRHRATANASRHLPT